MNATSGGGPPTGVRPSFTDAQRKALWNIPRATGALSLIGSCLLLYMLFKSSRHGLKRTQNRLLCAISVVDLPFSLMFVLGTILMPSELPIKGAYGNVRTCSFQGFMLQLGYAQPIYNAFLMAYYAITVCGGVRDEIISKWVEPCFHVFGILFAIGTAVAGVVLQIFNPSPVGRCAINSFPMGCVTNPRVPCQRGEDHRVYKWAFNLGPTLVSLAVMIFALAALACFVLMHERKSHKNARQRGSLSFRGDAAMTVTRRPAYSNQVVTRALVYAFIFLNTYSWITAANLVRVIAHVPPPYWLVLMGNVIQPFQGFCNFLLYLQPRYAAVRKCYAQWPMWRVCYYAIQHGTASLLPDNSRQMTRRDSSSGSRMGSTRWTSQKQRSSLSVTSGPDEPSWKAADGEISDESDAGEENVHIQQMDATLPSDLNNVPDEELLEVEEGVPVQHMDGTEPDSNTNEELAVQQPQTGAGERGNNAPSDEFTKPESVTESATRS